MTQTSKQKNKTCPQCAGIGEGFAVTEGPRGRKLVQVECHWCKGAGRVDARTAAKFRRLKRAKP